MMVLDTDVFIDHFWGLAAATAYIESLPADQRTTTDVTVMELYKGAANRDELVTITRFLTRNRVTCLPIAAAASQRAVALVLRTANKVPVHTLMCLALQSERGIRICAGLH